MRDSVDDNVNELLDRSSPRMVFALFLFALALLYSTPSSTWASDSCTDGATCVQSPGCARILGTCGTAPDSTPANPKCCCIGSGGTCLDGPYTRGSIPTVSSFGLMALVLLVFGAGVWMLRSRRSPENPGR